MSRFGPLMLVKQNTGKKKVIHNTFSRQNKKKSSNQIIPEVFHINFERQEIGIFYIDESSSGNTK